VGDYIRMNKGVGALSRLPFTNALLCCAKCCAVCCAVQLAQKYQLLYVVTLPYDACGRM
jgi:hypothetical protein